MNFNLFPKKKSVDEILETNEVLYDSIKKEANDLVSGVVNGVYEIIALKNELQHQLDENAKLNLQVTALHKIIEGGKDSIDDLKKDVEDQKQLKDSLQRVNEKYIKKITEQEETIIILKQAIERWHSRSKEWEKMDEEIQSSVSELTKEVRDLRHLKTENVELIERIKNLEEDPFTNNWGSLYESAYKERDEYKHQLNAAIKEIEKLKESNFTQRNQWYGVCEYIINHAELKNHGVVVENACLRFLKERDDLKAEVEKLKNKSQKHPMYPLHWGGYDKNIIDFVNSEFSNEDPLEGKQVEFNAEELLKRVTEYADSLDTLPKSFPDEFQKEKSWEEAASDLALKVAKLERMVEELKVVRVNNNLNLDLNYEFFKKNGKWPWQWNEAESLNEKLYD